VIIRNYTKNDFSQLIRVQQESFRRYFHPIIVERREIRQSCFEGALYVEIGGRVGGILAASDGCRPSSHLGAALALGKINMYIREMTECGGIQALLAEKTIALAFP
jgi:hypothetical protein